MKIKGRLVDYQLILTSILGLCAGRRVKKSTEEANNFSFSTHPSPPVLIQL
jgi:hypothetical protein